MEHAQRCHDPLGVSLTLGPRLMAGPACCGDDWFDESMALLNRHADSHCQARSTHITHLLASVVQIFSRRLLLPRNTTWMLMTTVIYNGPVVGVWCPLALHMAKFLQAEIHLLSALPAISEETPLKIRLKVISQAMQFEREGHACHYKSYGHFGEQLVSEGRKRLRRFRGYVRRPGGLHTASWRDDVDVQLAHSWHVSLKECQLSNFSVGDVMDESQAKTMATSASLWEQALLSIHYTLQDFNEHHARGVSYVLTGGTLLALLRHGTAARKLGGPRGVVDFVDKDIDMLVITDNAADWWATIVFVDEALRSNGWQGCSLSVRDSRTMLSEVELEELRLQTGHNLFSRGVMELVCGIFGTDAVTYKPAVVPFNAVWLQTFRFKGLVNGRRLYQQASMEKADFVMSSSACTAGNSCFALPHFPFQSWRGALPMNALLPIRPCAFLPNSVIVNRLLLESLGVDRKEGRSVSRSVPCPQQALSLLRWYDRGELWGRIEGRPCLAMPLVVDHDRVKNSDTSQLTRHGLSATAIRDIQKRMMLVERLGGMSLLEESYNCTLSRNGTYSVPESKFKGSSNAEADCGPKVINGRPHWRSARTCPHGVRDYNDRLRSLLEEWSPRGYLRPRSARPKRKAELWLA